MHPRFSVLFMVVIPAISQADSGDVKTLKQERELFPDVLETITGKFAYHSPDFYKWQMRDRQQKLTSDPNNATWQDDLAIAYAMTGDYENAVSTMTQLETKQPGRYETQANLGLIYFLKKDGKQALPALDKALAIQPDANSGRERYLRWIVEYMLENPGRRMPLAPIDANSEWPYRSRSFAIFLRQKLNKQDLDLADAQAAARGIVGIMRAGSHQSTLMLEFLGDVLCYSSDPTKVVPTKLATRTYLRAAYTDNNPGIRRSYIALAEWALVHRQKVEQPPFEGKNAMPVLTRVFEEVEDATAWHDQMRAKESELIAGSADPEGDFNRLYAEQPRVPDDPTDSWFKANEDSVRAVALGALAMLALIAIVVVAFRIARGVRGRREQSPPG